MIQIPKEWAFWCSVERFSAKTVITTPGKKTSSINLFCSGSDSIVFFTYCSKKIAFKLDPWTKLNLSPGLHLQNQHSHASSVAGASRTVIATLMQLHNCLEVLPERVSQLSYLRTCYVIVFVHGTTINKQVLAIVNAQMIFSGCICLIKLNWQKMLEFHATAATNVSDYVNM